MCEDGEDLLTSYPTLRDCPATLGRLDLGLILNTQPYLRYKTRTFSSDILVAQIFLKEHHALGSV